MNTDRHAHTGQRNQLLIHLARGTIIACSTTLVAIAILLLIASPTYAETRVVTSTLDTGPGTLRQAVYDAVSDDVIMFNLPAQSIIVLTSGQLSVTKSLSFDGSTSPDLTIGANGTSRLIEVGNGSALTLKYLTLTGGSPSVHGGAIYNRGSLLIENSWIISNSNLPADSMIGLGVNGGAIYNTGRLSITHSTLTNNHADGNGGAIYNDGHAGEGKIEITDSFIQNNVAGYIMPSGDHYGGGIYNDTGSVSLNESSLLSNTAESFWYHTTAGGAIYNDGALTVSHSLMINNHAGSGGGIMNNTSLAIDHSTIADNSGCQATGGGGGGVVNTTSGIAVASAIRLSRNSGCSGANTFGDTMAGGFTNWGVLSMTDSVLDRNIVNTLGSGMLSSGHLLLINSTLSDNIGTGLATKGVTIIRNSTIYGNSGLGIIQESGGDLTLQNSIVARNSTNIAVTGGAFTSLGYNLTDSTDTPLTETTDITNTDPLLGSLLDNGGNTLTRAPLPWSPAVNHGDPNFTPPPEYDQRGPGNPRVLGGRIDIGAYELMPIPANVVPRLYLPVVAR